MLFTQTLAAELSHVTDVTYATCISDKTSITTECVQPEFYLFSFVLDDKKIKRAFLTIFFR